jgi:hypothetical protein
MAKWKDLTNEQYPSHDFGMEKVLEGCLVEKRDEVGPNKSKLFVIEKKGGSKVCVWGSTVLNRLSSLSEGTVLRIEYLGTVKGKGPKPYKNYLIQVDEDTIPQRDVVAEVFGV